MNSFWKGINPIWNGMNMFQTGMETFRIGTGIWGHQNYHKIRIFSVSKNLKDFFQNSNFLDLVRYETKILLGIQEKIF